MGSGTDLTGKWLPLGQDGSSPLLSPQSALVKVQLPEWRRRCGTRWPGQKILLNPQTCGSQIGQVRSISTISGHAPFSTNKLSSCCSLEALLPGPFYGHDAPISVFNFHSPFGGSEIPQR
ncbi:unnamed protein product [Pipistrellus nathusii]|uniref:Uncharacterized protein n=1 Tax=Pipistrellus nathusii TaxID=59473 RepID=A0ABN9ZU55_PIPNA